MFKRTGNGTIDSLVSEDIIKMLMPKGWGSGYPNNQLP